MEQVLIVTSSEQSKNFLESFVKGGFTSDITIASNASAARRLVMEREYEVVIINAPLRDEGGTQLAVHVSETTASGVVLIVKAENEEEIADEVGVSGVLTVPKPISKPTLAQTIRLASASHARLAAYRRQAASLEGKIEEIRTVDKAKYALIECLGMTEKEAHRYIEKQSMDKRMPKRKVAEAIIEEYGI